MILSTEVKPTAPGRYAWYIDMFIYRRYSKEYKTFRGCLKAFLKEIEQSNSGVKAAGICITYELTNGISYKKLYWKTFKPFFYASYITRQDIGTKFWLRGTGKFFWIKGREKETDKEVEDRLLKQYKEVIRNEYR